MKRSGKTSSRLTDEDRRQWETFSQGIAPLSPSPARAVPKALPEKHPDTQEMKNVPPRKAAGVTVDRRSDMRLKRGQWPIDGRLDLHGLTQEVAHRQLRAFMARQWAQGSRCVLIITGKGAGVLQQMVPRWLAESDLQEYVLRTSPAQPHHGGTGALYVLLRRRRI